MYQHKVTKWISGALSTLQSHMFWFLMSVCHRARDPVRHMFNILSKYSKHSERSKPCEPCELPIVNFITRRIADIDAEFCELRSTLSTWTGEILTNLEGMSQWFKSEPLDTNSLKSIAFKLVAFNHATYVRRIVKPFARCTS